jgi:DNA-binding transcriptional regulator GbsR (MarR family)
VTAKRKFIELVTELQRIKGLDELTSKLIGNLFAEPREISLDGLSKRTGYSLSAVSTCMKFLERTGLVRRIRKPGSKKVYFFMEKDLLSGFTQQLMKVRECVAMLMERLPAIIADYRKEKAPREELRLVQAYQRQLVAFDGLMNEFGGMMKEVYRKLGKKP